jgi:hypothetical protein
MALHAPRPMPLAICCNSAMLCAKKIRTELSVGSACHQLHTRRAIRQSRHRRDISGVHDNGPVHPEVEEFKAQNAKPIADVEHRPLP